MTHKRAIAAGFAAAALSPILFAVPAMAYTVDDGKAMIPDDAPTAEAKPEFVPPADFDPEFSVAPATSDDAQKPGLPDDTIPRPTIIPGVPTPTTVQDKDSTKDDQKADNSSSKADLSSLFNSLSSFLPGILPVAFK